MIKGPIRLLALLALALGAVFAVPAVASAHCVGECHLPPSHSPSASPSPTKTATASPSPTRTETASPTPTKTLTAPPTTTVPTTPVATVASSVSGSPVAVGLPVTGAKEDVMAGAGVLLLLAGAGGVLYGRRNRTRFEA